MSAYRKLSVGFFVIIFGVACCSFLYNPYGEDEIKAAKHKAQRCDNEAISYLGDFYEKRGLEGELRDLLQLSQECSQRSSSKAK